MFKKLVASLLLVSSSSWAGLPPTTIKSQNGSKSGFFNLQTPARQVTKVNGTTALIETGSHNLAENPGFEASAVTTGWTASGGTLAKTTTSGQFRTETGVAAASWDGSAAAQTLSNTSYTASSVENAEASVWVKVASGTATHKLQVYDGTNVVGETTINSSTSGFVKTTLNYVTTPGSTYALRLITVASDEPAIYVDDVYNGKATNISYLQAPFEIDSGNATVTYDGNYTVVKFTSSGSFRVSQPITADILTVGGGGGGSGGASGNALAGGGAGGVLYTTGKFVGAGTYSVTVGTGGAGSSGVGGGNGATGGNSDISGLSGLTAYGGGGGGGSSTGGSGGSGGGGSFNSHLASGGSGTGGQGTAGGASYSSGGVGGGGGGGGCASSGGGATAGGGGNGGAGCANSITGSSVYYGGGGAGSGTSGGTGGVGGGGSANQAGTDGLGGGGGGGGSGYEGGDGVVILRFLTPPNVGSYVYRPELQAMSWSGYHDASYGNWNFTNTSSFDDPSSNTSNGNDVTELTNTNFGTVTSYVSGARKLPGIVFTPKITGKIDVCATPGPSNAGASGGTFQLVDVTNSNVIAESPVGDSSTNAASPLCGTLSVPNLNPITLAVRGKKGAAGTMLITSYNTTTRMMGWKLSYQSANIPAPVLVGGLTTGSSYAERVEDVKVTSQCSSSPCTISSQSGSWVSSISRSGTGSYTVNINSGVFSSAPSCFVQGQDATGVPLCRLSGAETTTSVGIYCADYAGSAVDGGLRVFCKGPR